MATYALVHGAFTGGWVWRTIADDLRAVGHDVFTPTLTGSGERVHLADPDVGLTTHILDVANVLRYEDLYDITLVGYSYGGSVVTGVAEQVPERLARLIYLDAWVPQNGETLYGLLGPQLQKYFEHSLETGDGWRVAPKPPVLERNTPTLARPWKEPISLKSQSAAAIPRAYVLFTGKPPDDPLKPVMEGMAARAHAQGWQYRELAATHQALVERPHEVAALLLELL